MSDLKVGDTSEGHRDVRGVAEAVVQEHAPAARRQLLHRLPPLGRHAGFVGEDFLDEDIQSVFRLRAAPIVIISFDRVSISSTEQLHGIVATRVQLSFYDGS